MFPPVSPIVLRLIILNVAVFLLLAVFGSALPFDLREQLMLYYPGSRDFLPVQLVSHFFLHAGLSHLFYNMFGLYVFGPAIEDRLGQRNFVLLYLIAACGSAALHLGMTWFEIFQGQRGLEAFLADPGLATFTDFFNGEDLVGQSYVSGNGQRTSIARVVGDITNALSLNGATPQELAQARTAIEVYVGGIGENPMLGASGAVSGVLAAYLFFYPFRELRLFLLPVSLPAWVVIVFLLATDFTMGFLSIPGDNVAHFAHIGGAIAGGIAAYFFAKQPPSWMKRIN